MNNKQLQSVEVPNSGRARTSTLASSGEISRFFYPDVTTLWEGLQRGRRISADSKFLGWRSNKTGYSWITYDEFTERAYNFASGLVKVGMKPGQDSKIGNFAQNCVEVVVVQYACFSQSAVVVPLYDTLGAAACAFMINQAEIEIVFCDKQAKVRKLLEIKLNSLKHIVTSDAVDEDMRKMAEGKGIQLHAMEDIEKLGKDNRAAPLLPSSDDISIICYTSGTTSDPKGVILTHGNLVSASCAAAKQMGKSVLTKDDTVISYLPLAHVFEQAVQVLITIEGGSIGFYSGDINVLVDDIRTLQPTFLPAVPRLLNKLYSTAQRLLENNREPMGDLEGEEAEKKKKEQAQREAFICKKFYESLGGKVRLIISGAAPINTAVLEFFKILGIQVMEAYGQTENSGPCTINAIETGNVGPPVPCCIVKLKDAEEMGYFSREGTGEICIKGYNVFKGYYKNPQLTAEALDSEGWLYTGDIGMWTTDGCLKVIDRKKHIMKLSQGEYVAPEKVESAYAMCPFVNQVMVHGDSLKDFLVAIVVPDEASLATMCREKFGIESWSAACESKALKTFMLGEMHRIGKEAGLNSLEQVKAIHLHSEPCTYEGGFLTPTSKVKRDVWRVYFQDELDNLYRNYENEMGQKHFVVA